MKAALLGALSGVGFTCFAVCVWTHQTDALVTSGFAAVIFGGLACVWRDFG